MKRSTRKIILHQKLGEIVFDFPDKNSGTMLRFSHADWKAETDYVLACNTTWGELMFRLKACAEGKTRGPLFTRSAIAYEANLGACTLLLEDNRDWPQGTVTVTAPMLTELPPA